MGAHSTVRGRNGAEAQEEMHVLDFTAVLPKPSWQVKADGTKRKFESATNSKRDYSVFTTQNRPVQLPLDAEEAKRVAKRKREKIEAV